MQCGLAEAALEDHLEIIANPEGGRVSSNGYTLVCSCNILASQAARKLLGAIQDGLMKPCISIYIKMTLIT